MKIKFTKFLFIILILNSTLFLSSVFNYANIQSAESDLVILNHFPVDMNLLFYQDNATMLNEVLEGIENIAGILPLTPFGGFFLSNHIEGADKWYFDSYRQLEVFCPHEGTVESLDDGEGGVDIVDSNEVVTDVVLNIDIGGNCEILYGHLTILKSIYDEITSSGGYSFSANEHIGYQTYNSTTGISILDFYYITEIGGVCPYNAFNLSLQTDLSALYDLQYQSMKKSGLYPQSTICNNMDIDIASTIWGVWKYNTGPFDDYADGDLTLGLYAFDIHTFFNRQFANPETYWRDYRDQDTNLTSDIIGIFGDNSGASDIPGYNRTYISHVKLYDGTYELGILEICTWDASDWSPTNTTLYVKFEVSSDLAGYIDDELIIEFFQTTSQAEGSFTDLNRTYIRYDVLPEEPTTSGDVNLSIFSLVIGIVPIAIILQVIYKRRKRSN